MQEEPKVELSEREIKRLDRERATNERVNAEKALTAEYLKIAKTPAFQDLLSKVKSFGDYHLKIAKDGVGLKDVSEGRQEIIKLSHEERVSELDKAAGIEEILDYLTRKTTITTSTNKGKNDE